MPKQSHPARSPSKQAVLRLHLLAQLFRLQASVELEFLDSSLDDLWDYDLPTAPILADLTVNGELAAPLLTKTLLFLRAGDMVGLSMPPVSGGNMFRAYDKKTGKVLWEKDLGAGTTGAPMTYMHNGKQYVVVAVGGVRHPPELVALIIE